jgi:hypothetical protein
MSIEKLIADLIVALNNNTAAIQGNNGVTDTTATGVAGSTEKPAGEKTGGKRGPGRPPKDADKKAETKPADENPFGEDEDDNPFGDDDAAPTRKLTAEEIKDLIKKLAKEKGKDVGLAALKELGVSSIGQIAESQGDKVQAIAAKHGVSL